MPTHDRRSRSFLTALALAIALALVGCAAAVDTDPNDNGPTDPGPTDPGPTDPTDPDPTPPAGPGAWATVASTPSARQEVAYVEVGGRLYLAGGSTAHAAYDPATDDWTPLTPLPGWRDHVQGVAVGGLIYYIGGLTAWPEPATDEVLVYDPGEDEFTTGTPMPRPRGGGGVAAHGGLIYYAGGLAEGEAVAWFDAYDPATGEWDTTLPDMPEPRDHFHAAVVDGVFYVIGGRDTHIDATTGRVDAFDIAAGTWSTLDTELPTPRGGFAAAVLGREILVIGGEGGGATFEEVEAYDTQTNTWRTLAPMPTPRHGIQAAVHGGCVYVAAGGEAQGHAPSAVHEVFSFDEPTDCGVGSSPSFSSISWTTVADALEPGRMEASGMAAGDALYVFGGYTSWSPGPLCTTDHAMAFDAATGEWSALAPMPAPWTHAGAVHDGGSIYLAGGRENVGEGACATDVTGEVSSAAVLRYDIAGDSWHTDVPPLPEARSSGGFVKVGRNLHFFGGVSSGHPGGYAAYYDEEGDHWTLSLDGGTEWQPLAPMPEPRSHLAAVALGGRIYAVGGQLGEGGLSTTLGAVHRYDPDSNEWTEVASLPATLSHKTASTLAIGDRVVVLGGERHHGQPVNEVLAYDPAADEWSQLTPLPATRRSGVAGLIGGKIYYTTGGGAFSRTTYQGTLVP